MTKILTSYAFNLIGGSRTLLYDRSRCVELRIPAFKGPFAPLRKRETALWL